MNEIKLLLKSKTKLLLTSELLLKNEIKLFLKSKTKLFFANELLLIKD